MNPFYDKVTKDESEISFKNVECGQIYACMVKLNNNQLVCLSFNTSVGSTEDLQKYFPSVDKEDKFISYSIGQKICALDSINKITCWDNHKM